jgi:probable HAF family extracellular repeat protein
MGLFDEAQAGYGRSSCRGHEGAVISAASRGTRPGAALLLAAAFGVASATVVRAQIPCGYEVTAAIQGPFCSPFGYPPTIPTAIGANGLVVGYYYLCVVGPSRPFRWTPGAGFVPLALPLGFNEGAAWGIDDQTGWIVGSTDRPGTDGPFATVWQAGVPLVLGTLPGGDYSDAFASANGRVVGQWGNESYGNPGRQGLLWEDGVLMDLGADLGTPSGEARGVNQAGMTVGWMGGSFVNDSHAFLWTDGIVTDLGVIPGGFTALALAINDAEPTQVVGYGHVPADSHPFSLSRAFLWQQGSMTNLAMPPGSISSAALAISDSGVIVGQLLSETETTGFVWDAGVMADLNTLIPPDAGLEILIAHAINNAGQIACDGWNEDNNRIGILLTPVQIPPGDLDCDGAVSREDLQLLLDAWGPCPAEGTCAADMDGDGAVGIVDFLTLLANWG